MKQEIKDTINATIEKAIWGEKHKNYEDMQKVKAFCEMVVTGKGQDDYIRNLRPSESEAQKEQRIKLYNSATKQAVSPVKREYKKIETVEGQKLVLKIGDQNKEGKLLQIFDSFFANKNIQKHTFDRLCFYTFYDPNAMLLTRPKYTTEGKTTLESVYPVEIPSEKKVLWSKFAGDYEFVITEQIRLEKRKQTIKSKGGEKIECKDYTYYAIHQEVQAFDVTEIMPDSITQIVENLPDNAEYEERELRDDENRVTKKYIFVYYDTINETFPLVDFGYIFDEVTNGEIFMSPISDCEELFKDLMRDKSLADNTVMLHAFPQEIRVGSDCEHTETHGEYQYQCERGYINGRTCPKCEGTGVAKHKSEQQVLFVKAKLLHEYGFKLSDLAYYHLLPEWFLPKLEERIKAHIEAIYKMVFNTDIPKVENTGDKTATEINYNNSEQYKARKEFARKHAEIVTHVMNLGVEYFEAQSDETHVYYTYPEQLLITDLNDLYAKLETALSSQSPVEVITPILNSIVDSYNIDNPLEAKRLKLRMLFKPFVGKTLAEIATILVERDTEDFDRVLYENHAAIFDYIEAQDSYKTFVTSTYDRQLEEVKKAVDAYKVNINYIERDLPVSPSDFQV